MSRITISFITVVLLIFAACDIIEEPYMTDHQIDNGDTTEVVRKVLLEVFTGHRCPGCPAAAEMVTTLQEHYGDQLVAMSIHAGFFALPMGQPFEYDFTTNEGKAIHDHFGVSAKPIGMINRNMYGAGRLVNYSAWPGEIEEIISKDENPDFQIIIELEPQNAQGKWDASITVNALFSCSDTYYLSVFLIEDAIVKPQQHGDHGVIHDYVHNNVLRKGVNGAWGEVLNVDNFTSDDSFTKDYVITLDAEWVPENCSVIAFVYREDTMQIHQVEIAPLF